MDNKPDDIDLLQKEVPASLFQILKDVETLVYR